MDSWPEFFKSSWGKEFVAGGCGGIAGIFAGYPLDTVRIKQQNCRDGSAFGILKNVAVKEGPLALYRGMGAPLAFVTFQNAMVFQCCATLSRVFDPYKSPSEPSSYESVALGGVGAGALQSVFLTPVDLLKIRLQVHEQSGRGPLTIAKNIVRAEGWKGMFRGLPITFIRDVPSHGVYFWTYEYVREKLHPGCRKSGQQSCTTMIVSGGLAGVASWLCCYPLDVVKTRLQAQTPNSSVKYNGIVDCFQKSVRKDGKGVLFRGLGSAVCRAFVVNGAVFTAYETALRVFFNNDK